MKQAEVSRYKDLGPLHDLLLEACPPDENGTRSIVVLSKKLEVSHQYIYLWIEKGRVPARFVRSLVESSEGRVTYEQFHEFVF